MKSHSSRNCDCTFSFWSEITLALLTLFSRNKYVSNCAGALSLFLSVKKILSGLCSKFLLRISLAWRNHQPLVRQYHLYHGKTFSAASFKIIPCCWVSYPIVMLGCYGKEGFISILRSWWIYPTVDRIHIRDNSLYLEIHIFQDRVYIRDTMAWLIWNKSVTFVFQIISIFVINNRRM